MNNHQEERPPQNGQRLKELRLALGKNQSEMAGLLQKQLKPNMPHGFVVQQPDISRLEREQTALDIPKLLAYTTVFDVDIATLLNEQFNGLCNSEVLLRHFASNQTAAEYLSMMENDGRTLAYSQFPASYFLPNRENNCRFEQIARADYPEVHMYTLDALLNFIFSPICHYSYQERQQIFHNYLQHFRHSCVKNLRFFSRTEFPGTNLFPNLLILPKKSTLIMLAPVMQRQQGDVFLEIRSQEIFQQVYNFYYKQVVPLDATMNLLKIGHETLAMLEQGFSMERAIRFFYTEIKKRSPEDRAVIYENFSTDIQEMLAEA